MIKVIKTDVEYEKALREVEALIDWDPPLGTEDGDRLELLTFLISKYEEECFPLEMPEPIEAIRFRMEQQGLTHRDLIPYIGSRSKVSEVLRGKRPLSLKMIRALNKELGIPAEVLLREEGASISAEALEIDWNKLPINEMAKRQWFQGFRGSPTEAKEHAEELVPAFFSHMKPGEIGQALCRQNVRSASSMDNYALLAWQAKVLHIALAGPIPVKYVHGTVTQDFLREVVRLSYFEQGPRLALEFLEKSGIPMVILRHLPKTYLDGAAMLLPDGTPVVALTLRYDRLDNFWFCLCHELAHIALHLENGNKDCFFDDLDFRGDEFEEEADKMASNALIPPQTWENAAVRHHHSHHSVRDFADRLRICPALVAGRIRLENNNYRILSRMLGHGEVGKHFPEATAV